MRCTRYADIDLRGMPGQPVHAAARARVTIAGREAGNSTMIEAFPRAGLRPGNG